MINTLNIGKYVHAVLTRDEQLQALIGSKVYPLVADNDTKFPFVVYKRVSVIASNNKDIYHQDDATVEINIITDRYSTGVQIASLIRSILEKRNVEFEDMCITDCILSQASEEYEDGFVQKLQFQMTIIKN